MVLGEFVEYLRRKRDYRQQIVHVEHIPARTARYGNLKRPLPTALQQALSESGTERLYTHQAQAINAIRDGQNVIVATSTASGKTLVYNVPVIESLLADPRARALYLFPTKALAQDQLRSLRQLTTHALRNHAYGTYATRFHLVLVGLPALLVNGVGLRRDSLAFGSSCWQREQDLSASRRTRHRGN